MASLADVHCSLSIRASQLTSAECKTIRIAVSTVKDSWVTALGLRPHVYKPVCVWISGENYLGQVKGLDMIELGWCPLHLC